MDCISFIGTGTYTCTNYNYKEKSFETAIFSNACIEFFEPERLYLVMTDEAEAKHFHSIVKDKCDVIPVKIPRGVSEDEIWTIFNIIENAIEANNEIVIDVTHSFRSLPIISMAVAQYLSVVKNVKINKIVYGAYEAKDENNKTPVFELTSFLDIINWTSSINEFLKFGNAEGFKDILNSIQKEAFINNSPVVPLTLSSFGQNVNNLTKALLLTRPKEVIEYSKKLSNNISDFDSEINRFAKAKPAINILNLFKEKYSSFINCANGINLFSKDGFDVQCKMMQFYIDTCKYVQAITLARELFVSYLMYEFDLSPYRNMQLPNYSLNNRENRAIFEKSLGFIIHEPVFENYEIRRIWLELTNIRNDINHAGLLDNASSSQKAADKISSWIPKLINFLNNELTKEDIEVFNDIIIFKKYEVNNRNGDND